MISLKDFLETADQDNQVALQQARDYSAIQPMFLTSNTLTVYVVQAGLYNVFAAEAQKNDSPVQGICMALMDRLKGTSEFNLSETLPLGQANINMLNTLAQVMTDHTVMINALRDTLIGISNKVVYPFANVTLHDVLITRDACPTKELFSVLTPPNTYIIVNLLSDVPTHSARITAVNPRTNQREILGRVWLSKAALYQFKVPSHYSDYSGFEIDDSYGAIE